MVACVSKPPPPPPNTVMIRVISLLHTQTVREVSGPKHAQTNCENQLAINQHNIILMHPHPHVTTSKALANIDLLASTLYIHILGCYGQIKQAVSSILPLNDKTHAHINFTTVELPNNGHIGSGPFVLYIEVIPL